MIVLILMVRLDLFLDDVLGEILDPKHYTGCCFGSSHCEILYQNLAASLQ